MALSSMMPKQVLSWPIFLMVASTLLFSSAPLSSIGRQLQSSLSNVSINNQTTQDFPAVSISSSNHSQVEFFENALATRKSPSALSDSLKQEEYHLVHIGKTGGSSLRYFIYGGVDSIKEKQNSTKIKCQQMTESSTTSSEHICALAKHNPNTLHIPSSSNLAKLQAMYQNANRYLVPVRNPLDRLMSWFEYEKYLVLEREWYYFGYQKLKWLATCYPTLQELALDALNQNSTQKPNSCQQLAQECILGETMCAAHNFFNYEFYLEWLIAGKECTHTNLVPCRQDVRIDVLRLEHYEQDFGHMMYLWTGTPGNFTQLGYLKKNANQNNSTKKNGLNSEASSNLCRAICSDLMAYKKILLYSKNLQTKDIQQSYQELDQTCGFSVDQVCRYKFRNVFPEKYRCHEGSTC